MQTRSKDLHANFGTNLLPCEPDLKVSKGVVDVAVDALEPHSGYFFYRMLTLISALVYFFVCVCRCRRGRLQGVTASESAAAGVSAARGGCGGFPGDVAHPAPDPALLPPGLLPGLLHAPADPAHSPQGPPAFCREPQS